MWGVLSDNLSDARERLPVEGLLRAKGFAAAEISPFERLAIAGEFGMGVLGYRPAWVSKCSCAEGS